MQFQNKHIYKFILFVEKIFLNYEKSFFYFVFNIPFYTFLSRISDQQSPINILIEQRRAQNPCHGQNITDKNVR